MDLLSKLKTITDLPTIPTTVVKVLRVAGSETASAADLAKVIIADQSLAAKILKVANSALYSLPRKVHDIQHAVTLLGFREVRDVAFGMGVFDSMYLAMNRAYWNRAKFWEHSYVVAYLTRELARRSGSGQGENAFAAGLLHDVGKVILDRYFAGYFRRIIEMVDATQASYYDVEIDVLSVGHDTIGGYVMGTWSLPDELVAGVAGHHHPSQDTEPMAAWVYLANLLANASGFPAMSAEPAPTLDEIWELPETVALRNAGRFTPRRRCCIEPRRGRS
jgi:putative nucleotidyltransferase with HDIG domain